jgi:hypothetical protein
MRCCGLQEISRIARVHAVALLQQIGQQVCLHHGRINCVFPGGKQKKKIIVLIAESSLRKHVPLDKTLKVVMDGRKIEISPDVFGLMVLNISSYAGGADLYGSSAGEPHLGFKPQSFSDGLIEVGEKV